MKNLGDVRRQEELRRDANKYKYETNQKRQEQHIDRETQANVERVVAEWNNQCLEKLFGCLNCFTFVLSCWGCCGKESYDEWDIFDD